MQRNESKCLWVQCQTTGKLTPRMRSICGGGGVEHDRICIYAGQTVRTHTHTHLLCTLCTDANRWHGAFGLDYVHGHPAHMNRHTSSKSSRRNVCASVERSEYNRHGPPPLPPPDHPFNPISDSNGFDVECVRAARPDRNIAIDNRSPLGCASRSAPRLRVSVCERAGGVLNRGLIRGG